MNFGLRFLRDKPIVVVLWIIVALMLVSLFGPPKLRLANTEMGTTMAGAVESLKLIKDWGVWLAGIQTASLAAMAALVKEGGTVAQLTSKQLAAAKLVVCFNGAAMFFSAWLLTSLSSLMLRVTSVPSREHYDVYEMHLYGWMAEYTWTDGLKLGYVIVWGHLLWALGIVAFSAFAYMSVSKRAA